MVQGLTKPIIFTGGKSKMFDMNNDIVPNLKESCFIAGAYDIPEVCIYCNSKLYRANRTFLYDPASFDAFNSPNFELLGKKDETMRINWGLVRKRKHSSDHYLTINKNFEDNVTHCYNIPDLSKEQIDDIFHEDKKAILIEAFGTGNLPGSDSYFVEKMKAALKMGIPVFHTSQCHKGRIASTYEVSASAFGTISCEDLTIPAAIAKIGFLVKKCKNMDELRLEFMKDFRGESNVNGYIPHGEIGGIISHAEQTLTSIESDEAIAFLNEIILPSILLSSVQNNKINFVKELIRYDKKFNLGLLLKKNDENQNVFHQIALNSNSEKVMELLIESKKDLN